MTGPRDVLVLYYSRHGSVKQMAGHVARGIEMGGMRARLRTVAPVSTVTEAIADAIPECGDPYVSLDDLADCSGMAWAARLDSVTWPQRSNTFWTRPARSG